MKTLKINLFCLLSFMMLFIASCSNEDNPIVIDEVDNTDKPSIKTTSEKNGYTINITNTNFSISKTTIETFVSTFHEVYPKMFEDYNTSAPKVIEVYSDPTYDGVAYAEIDKGKITISPKYINENPNDTDLLTHELMHLVQSYPYGSGPLWLTEGIADYARSVYGINNDKASWSLPTYSGGQHYTDAYRVTASFLKWVRKTYDNEIIKKLDINIRNETYTYNLWVEYTDYTLPNLWNLYAGKPLGDKDLTIGAQLKVSKENVDGKDALEGSLKLIDGDLTNKFLIFNYPSDLWVQQELTEELVADKYILTSGNDAEGRDPKDWTLSGSNDEQNWTDLDVRSGESFSDRNQSKEYTFDSSTKYKYYRLSVTANNGETIFQVSEWRLYKK